MRLLDQEYTAHPFLGSRRLTKWLCQQGEEVNRKRVQRLMRLMGLEAIYPKPKLSASGRGHRIYPYLLRNVSIQRVDQVWSTDITYVPLACGFMYLAAIIDWFSRYVLAWRLKWTPLSRPKSCHPSLCRWDNSVNPFPAARSRPVPWAFFFAPHGLHSG